MGTSVCNIATHSRVCAVSHIRRLRGGSQAHLLAGSDGSYWVTKFKNNPQTIRVLANEMFAGRLGMALGLPMAPVGIIDVPEGLVTQTPNLSVELGGTFLRCSTGKQFASRYVCDPRKSVVVDYLPQAMLRRLVNLDDFARVLVLDKWTANADGRQAVFSKPRKSAKFKATFVDQGYCFNASEWSFPDSPLRGVYSRNDVYASVTGWDAFEPALTRAEAMDIQAIAQCAAEIPEEWYEHDGDGLSRLIDELFRRRTEIRGLITAFRESSRSPFPNWLAR
jgi:hypothetical protein